VLTDKYGNTLYRHTITRQCEYDQPFDAVRVKPAEMLCSAYQVRALCCLFSCLRRTRLRVNIMAP
jgi:hypothetical protein